MAAALAWAPPPRLPFSLSEVCMATPKPWAIGDDCPACSGTLKPVPPPSDAARAAALSHDNPVPLPPTVDHASPAQIADLGDLYRCPGCGYSSRVAKPAPKAKAAAKAPVNDSGE
jgi:hypothetical protein